MRQIRELPQELLAYVDETGIDSYLYREYARAKRGQSVAGKISGRRFQRTNIVAAKVGERIVAPLEYKGSTDSSLFEFWFEQMLLPQLQANSVIVLDNATFHRKRVLLEMAAAAHCSVLFLPPYSPDLNDIEHIWAWLKCRLRSFLHQFPSLSLAISDAFLACS